MRHRRVTVARAAHAVVALLALAGVGIEYAAMAGSHPTAELGWRTVHFFSYFTILTNLLVAAVATGCALDGGGWHRRAASPSIRAATSVYILVVAVIFQLLLAGLTRLTPLGWWGNMLVHQAAPFGWLLCWAAFGPHGGIDARAPWRWLLYPLAYGAWTLAHGAASGWYPYPFVNVAKLGGLIVARNMALIGLFFLGLGWLFRWLDARIALRRQRIA